MLDIDDVPARYVHTFCGRLLSSTILQACGENIDLVASTLLFPLHVSSSLWIHRSNHLLLMSAVIGKRQWKSSQSHFLEYISCSIWHCIFAKTGINITSHDAGYRNKTKRRRRRSRRPRERKKIRRKENKRTKNRDLRELQEHINLLSL